MRSLKAQRIRRATTTLAVAALLGSLVGAAPAVGAGKDPGAGDATGRPGWQLKYVENFGKPIPEGGEWFVDDYSDPIDDLNDDNGDEYRLRWGPNFDAAMGTFKTMRKETQFGHNGWLTSSLSARDSGGRVDDSFNNVADRPSITNATVAGAGRVGAISTPKHTGGALIRSTEPLPRYYRIEFKLKTLNYGGERNGSLSYDGKFNGYKTDVCKTFFPWPLSTNDPIVPSDPCETDTAVNGSQHSYNSFHMLSIVDFKPMPRNLGSYHRHRKVLIDQFSPAPSRDSTRQRVCNSATGEYYPWNESNRTTVNMLFFNGPQSQRQTFVSDCDELPVAGNQISAAEMIPELMPFQDYQFAIERDETGYAIEASGNFKHVGQTTYRYHRNFIDTDRNDNGTISQNVPIFHYNVPGDEYDGRFNSSATVRGPYGSRTWNNMWPAGSEYPDYFVIGQPYTNVGEGDASVDDIRLYVRK
ncbi:hypothetical protein AB0M46_02200 [Dactylosporangium sp. NPDC051485]|uniref:hypothetical protein n=1 Tax=Dactylosporangium sp. NPDC051485 TaxID=3154846 RepID=UPI00342D75BD